LLTTRTIAVVGVSPDPARPSNGVYRYLKTTGDYAMYPVNPTIDELDGESAFASLSALSVVPDMVDVFRRSDHLRPVARGRDSGRRQEHLAATRPVDEQLAFDAEAAGLQVGDGPMLKVEHARLIAARRERG